MDIQKARAELEELPEIKEALQFIDGFDGYKYHSINNHRSADWLNGALYAWQAAKAQAVLDQLDVNSILYDIDCYFDSGLSNTERTANNLIQSIYEKLSGEVKAQEPAND